MDTGGDNKQRLWGCLCINFRVVLLKSMVGGKISLSGFSPMGWNKAKQGDDDHPRAGGLVVGGRQEKRIVSSSTANSPPYAYPRGLNVCFPEARQDVVTGSTLPHRCAALFPHNFCTPCGHDLHTNI